MGASPDPPPLPTVGDHLLRLLETKEGADVTFQVAQAHFSAHSLVLSARSPVFRAMLSSVSGSPPPTAAASASAWQWQWHDAAAGRKRLVPIHELRHLIFYGRELPAARPPVFRAMFSQRPPPPPPDGDGGGAAGRILLRIDDTAPAAFGALLHFVYADALPPSESDAIIAGGLAGMRAAGELLGAAGRYGVERLRLLCERAVRDAVANAATAAAALVIADRHRWAELKAFCVEYLAASPEMLEAMVRTEGYAEAKASRPSVLLEVFEKAAAGDAGDDALSSLKNASRCTVVHRPVCISKGKLYNV